MRLLWEQYQQPSGSTGEATRSIWSCAVTRPSDVSNPTLCDPVASRTCVDLYEGSKVCIRQSLHTVTVTHTIQFNKTQIQIQKQYNTIQYNTIQYKTRQDNTIQYVHTIHMHLHTSTYTYAHAYTCIHIHVQAAPVLQHPDFNFNTSGNKIHDSVFKMHILESVVYTGSAAPGFGPPPTHFKAVTVHTYVDG